MRWKPVLCSWGSHCLMECSCVLFGTFSVCRLLQYLSHRCLCTREELQLQAAGIGSLTPAGNFSVKASKSSHSLYPTCTKGRGAQAHPFIPSTEEKRNYMHNSSNSYKAGRPAEVSAAISYLCHSTRSVSIHRPWTISCNAVSELHLNETQ